MTDAFVADYRNPEQGEDAKAEDTYRFEAHDIEDAKVKAETWCLSLLGDAARTVELRLHDDKGAVVWTQRIVQDDSEPD